MWQGLNEGMSAWHRRVSRHTPAAPAAAGVALNSMVAIIIVLDGAVIVMIAVG